VDNVLYSRYQYREEARMTHDIETVVIGAGVVGLAIARYLATAGQEVLILERNNLFGSETSARHSEVIHAGIYYPKNSLKAKLCTRGKALLYDYCADHDIPHKRIEKIIVATNASQVTELDGINKRAKANGVNDLRSLSSNDIGKLEPAIKAQAGLLSPSTGIVDSHAFMLSLLGKAESLGAMIAYNSPVDQVAPSANGFTVSVGGEQNMKLSCKRLVNTAGHGACALAKSTHGFPAKLTPTAHYAKGNYFRLQGKTPVSRLIYPVPEPGGLGVHITLDMAGQSRFGPDVQWQDTLDYNVDKDRAMHFYNAIRRYWPALEDDALVPDYAGVRPKIELSGKAYNDFLIQSSSTHGMSGLVNLFGIESPGLTSSLAIAEYVLSQLQSD